MDTGTWRQLASCLLASLREALSFPTSDVAPDKSIILESLTEGHFFFSYSLEYLSSYFDSFL